MALLIRKGPGLLLKKKKIRSLYNLASPPLFQEYARNISAYLSACWSAPWALETARYQLASRGLLVACPLPRQRGCQGGNQSLEALSTLLCRMQGPFYAAKISSNCEEQTPDQRNKFVGVFSSK